MASRQQFKEDRAEAAAKLAAKDIGDINRTNEREEGYTLNSEMNFKQARAEAAAKLAAKDLEDVNKARDCEMVQQQKQQGADEQRPGVLGSMFKAAKEAVVGKPHESMEVRDRATENQPGVYDSATGKAKEYKDYTTEKAKEAKDKTMEKAGEYKDYAADKAKEAKDTTMQKAGEYKDYTAEKAKEGKDGVVGKLGELKDSAADAAKRTMGFFTGSATANKEDTVVVNEENKEYGGEGWGREKMVIKMEESRPGAMANALKAADKVINDVGQMDGEGSIHVERRREKM